MILDWLHPDLQVPASQRVLQVIGTGALKRDQLLYLLSPCIQRARIDVVLRELRQAGWLDRLYLPVRGEAVYLLTKDGQKQLDGVSGRVKTAHARIYHHLLVADVLARCIKYFGSTGWQWHDDPSDQIWMYRRNLGDAEKDIKRTMPPVSALVVRDGAKWWIDVDDGLRGNRQVYEACRNWVCSIDRFPPDLRRVLFIAPSSSRVEYLQQRIMRWGDPRVTFGVVGIDQAVEVLAGSAVPTH